MSVLKLLRHAMVNALSAPFRSVGVVSGVVAPAMKRSRSDSNVRDDVISDVSSTVSSDPRRDVKHDTQSDVRRYVEHNIHTKHDVERDVQLYVNNNIKHDVKDTDPDACATQGGAVYMLLLCTAWCATSAGANVVGKLLVAELPYPVSIAMFHSVTLSVIVPPVTRCVRHGNNHGDSDFLTQRNLVMFVLPLAGGKFLFATLSLFSIARIAVSFSSTVKATMPLFTVILTRLILGEKQTKQIYLSIVPIIGGVAIATVTELSFNMVGMVSALAATMGFAVQNILSKKCLRETGIHHLRLLVVIARISAVCFFPLWLLQDGTQIWSDHSLWNSSHTPRLVALLVIDGFFNFAQNMVAFTVIAMVTPLSYAVANATKRIVIITVSLLTLRNPVTLMNVVGMVTAIGGVFLYNRAKLEQSHQKRATPLLPSQQTHVDNSLLQNNNVSMAMTNHIVFQGDKAFSSANGDARTPDMYKTHNGYRIV